MKLEPILHSEVSQKEILTHIYGIQKDGNDDHICKGAKETQTDTDTDTDVKNRLLDYVGEGEGGVI